MVHIPSQIRVGIIQTLEVAKLCMIKQEGNLKVNIYQFKYLSILDSLMVKRDPNN